MPTNARAGSSPTLSVSADGQPRPSRSSTSAGVSSKSKIAAFSAMRSAFVDFGIATIRCSTCQRRTTCAGRDAVRLGDPHESRVAEVRRLERAVALELHPAAAMPVEHVAVEQRRAPLDLVDGGQAAGRPLELVDLPEAVVAHADLARESLRLQLEQPLPDVRPRAAARRPVDQPQVDVLEPERREALLERLPAPGPRSPCGSFVVRKISSRGTPLSATARPTSRSLPYIVAVSMCR